MFLTKEMRRRRLAKKIIFFIQAVVLDIAVIACFATLFILSN